MAELHPYGFIDFLGVILLLVELIAVANGELEMAGNVFTTSAASFLTGVIAKNRGKR